MIDRGFIGKEFPTFTVQWDESLSEGWDELFSSVSHQPNSDSSSSKSLPTIWPAVLSLHGTACFIAVWEDLGVDPLSVRLVREEYRLVRDPEQGESLRGRVRIDELSESADPSAGLAEQIDLTAEFRDQSGELMATYTCSFIIPLAVTKGTIP